MSLQPVTLDQTKPADTKAPAVSVVIPAYNVAPFIGEALDSVMAQTFTDFETIVINDGSPDTQELERVLEPYMERIIYLKQENGGAGAARNAGLRVARGEFVAFLDADDAWLPNFLSEQVTFIKSGEGYDFVYADAVLFGDSPKAKGTIMQREPSVGPLTFESLLGERCIVNTSSVVARRQPILDVGLFDETLRNSQDFDLWARLAKRDGARMSYQKKVLVRHRVRAGSLASDGINSVEGELKVLDKISRRSDLTTSERSTLARTVALRRASVAVDWGKRRLQEGDFAAARLSFEHAYDYYRSTKLRVVLLWLRLSPRTLQHFYRLRTT